MTHKTNDFTITIQKYSNESVSQFAHKNVHLSFFTIGCCFTRFTSFKISLCDTKQLTQWFAHDISRVLRIQYIQSSLHCFRRFRSLSHYICGIWRICHCC